MYMCILIVSQRGILTLSFKLSRDKNKKVHFMGIGGVSMSGLATILLKNGYYVSGSDTKESDITNRLVNLGADIYIGHTKNNIKNADLVVYTAAIAEDNEELMEAKNRNIELMGRAEFLGCLMKDYKYNIAIAGAHGKTTTTSMISYTTIQSKLDPTILVGGNVDVINGNFRIGESEYFITEACEYKASFLKFNPYIGILLNIDKDHMDYYNDIGEIEETFKKFADLIPEDGYLIGCADDNKVMNILNNVKCNTISYGIDNGYIRACDIRFDEKACAEFKVYRGCVYLFDIKLATVGKHNILNALATICTGLVLGLSLDDIKQSLLECKGAHRRFEYKGKFNNAVVIDDYAHHPVEIQATLATAKLINANKRYCIFQPHTYSRTISLFDEFSKCFKDADKVILMDIYAAREKDNGIVSSATLGDAIRENGVDCINIHSHEEVVKYLSENARENDLIMTIGAGDVGDIGTMLLNQ